MYIEEIISKRKGKEYKTVLVRESYREGSSVNHRTIANVSHLPQGCIQEIKRYLKGNSGDLDFSQVHVIDSKEYGASQAALSFARKLRLDTLIFSRKFQWRENILAMIVGKLLYPGDELFLTTLFAHTVLWESCGHSSNAPLDVSKHFYDPLNQLLSRKKNIQKKLQEMHLGKESVSLLFLVPTAVEEEVEYGEFTHLNHDEYRTKIFTTALLTNIEGCPIAVDIFPMANGNDAEKNKQIEKITKKFNLQNIVLIGSQNNFKTILEDEFTIIIALNPIQINDAIKNNITPLHLYSNDEIHEIISPFNPLFRYIFFINLERKKELKRERIELIKTTEKLLLKIQKKNQNILEEMEQIWIFFGNEEFFDWHIEKEKLHFSINVSNIEKNEQLDGCCIIFTNVEKEMLTAKEVVNAYRKLNQVQRSFRVIKTITMKACSISLDNRIHSHIIVCMLSYYLQWHMNGKLATGFKIGEEIKVKQSTLPEAFERLKSIKSHTIRIGEITLGAVKTSLDEEQRAILSALGVTLVAKLSR